MWSKNTFDSAIIGIFSWDIVYTGKNPTMCFLGVPEIVYSVNMYMLIGTMTMMILQLVALGVPYFRTKPYSQTQLSKETCYHYNLAIPSGYLT